MASSPAVGVHASSLLRGAPSARGAQCPRGKSAQSLHPWEQKRGWAHHPQTRLSSAAADTGRSPQTVKPSGCGVASPGGDGDASPVRVTCKNRRLSPSG